MDRFLCIEAFVRVAETQSFAEAARQLRLSKSVVTTRVQQLEEMLGDALFRRTTRTVRLSEMGKVFYRDCSELVARTNELVDQMREVRGTPAGTLHVTRSPASCSAMPPACCVGSKSAIRRSCWISSSAMP